MHQDTDSPLSSRDLERVIQARQQLRSYAPYSPTTPSPAVRRVARVRPLIQHAEPEHGGRA